MIVGIGSIRGGCHDVILCQSHERCWNWCRIGNILINLTLFECQITVFNRFSVTFKKYWTPFFVHFFSFDVTRCVQQFKSETREKAEQRAKNALDLGSLFLLCLHYNTIIEILNHEPSSQRGSCQDFSLKHRTNHTSQESCKVQSLIGLLQCSRTMTRISRAPLTS